MNLGPLSSFIKASDKQLHALASFGITLGAFLLLIPVNMYLAAVAGPLVGAAAGILKERYDKQHPDKHSYEVLDLVADLIGILLGLALIIYVCVCLK